MKALVKTLIVIAVIFLILLIVSFFLPGKMHVEKSITIKAPVEMVFEKVNVLKNWECWAPWYQLDKEIKITYSGPPSGSKAGCSWESKVGKLGKGILVLKECAPNQYIITEMTFPEKGSASGKFLFTSDTTGVTVVWSLETEIAKNPVSKYIGFFEDKLVGSDFNKGLKNLKKITEEEYALQLKYKVEETTTDKICALVAHDTCSQKNIGKTMGNAYGKIFKLAGMYKFKLTGPTFAIYHKYDSIKGFDIEMGVPAQNCKKIPKGDIECRSFESFKAIKTNYYGAYEGSCEAYGVMEKWVAKNKRTITGPPWEIYMTDPGTEKDTSKWLTVIMFPVK